ncbi:unnamed protein product [Lampetra fluviatilis]
MLECPRCSLRDFSRGMSPVSRGRRRERTGDTTGRADGDEAATFMGTPGIVSAPMVSPLKTLPRLAAGPCTSMSSGGNNAPPPTPPPPPPYSPASRRCTDQSGWLQPGETIAAEAARSACRPTRWCLAPRRGDGELASGLGVGAAMVAAAVVVVVPARDVVAPCAQRP